MAAVDRTPPLNALRAFEAAARLSSVRRAAEELRVSHGAVSRHIANLETYLGTKLFLRRRRQIELTPEGAKYNLQIRDAFSRIYQSTADMVAAAKSKTLRLKVPPTFAIRWLVPRLARFQAKHPEVSVEISTPFGPNLQHDFDMAVYYGDPHFPPDIVAERLFSDVLTPVVRPDLAAAPAALREPGDLARLALLHSKLRPDDWPLWLSAAGESAVDANSGLRFENSGLVYQAVAEGLGAAVAQFAFVADDLAAGRLAAPFPIYVTKDIAYYLIYAQGRLKNPQTRDFHAWIHEEAEKSNRRLPKEARAGRRASLPAP
jgi:LysR family glycine cleavage system transcriptional activator